MSKEEQAVATVDSTTAARTAAAPGTGGNPEQEDPSFWQILGKHAVDAEVTEVDHYRVRGGNTVETEFIITVHTKRASPDNKNETATLDDSKQQQEESSSSTAAPHKTTTPLSSPLEAAGTMEDLFVPFQIAKTYADFQELAQELKYAADFYSKTPSEGDTPTTTTSLPPEALRVIQYCEWVSHWTERVPSTPTGRVNFRYIEVLGQQRSQLITNFLQATCQRAPRRATDEKVDHPLVAYVSRLIERFFLTDHCSGTTSTSIPTQQTTSEKTPPVASGNESSPNRETVPSNTKQEHLNPLPILAFLKFNQPNDKEHNKKQQDDKEQNKQNPTLPMPVIVTPLTRTDRRSELTRELDVAEFQQMGDDATLLTTPEYDAQNSARSVVASSKTGETSLALASDGPDTNPWYFLLGAAAAIYCITHAKQVRVQMAGDHFAFLMFASFCVGLHTPKHWVSCLDASHLIPGTAASKKKTPAATSDTSGRKLLKRSMLSRTRSDISQSNLENPIAHVVEAELPTDQDNYHDPVLGSPMARFPDGAEIGTVTNCWGESNPSDFKIRGKNYLKDRKKIPSEDFLFPMRGVDLFLTDTCPTNVGGHSAMLGGHVRDVPTFLINFRLPWGVLVVYYEIPARFVPYLDSLGETEEDEDSQKKRELVDALKKMTPGDRTISRFLMKPTKHKNQTLKIVPIVVKGPWVVRQVVGGKPAIIGNKMPINYIYQPGNPSRGQAPYLEADLDIAASSAARGILSVARAYTNILTLDLGFVVQGNVEDELPEQMLVGCRLHGIDPLTAPPFPEMTDISQMEDFEEDLTIIPPNAGAKQ